MYVTGDDSILRIQELSREIEKMLLMAQIPAGYRSHPCPSVILGIAPGSRPSATGLRGGILCLPGPGGGKFSCDCLHVHRPNG